MLKKISEYDVVYISYDEPNKEQHWARIKRMVPHAQRVDGVTGFDAAHKAAAALATTERVVTIDGDNELLDNFITMEIDDEVVPKDAVVSWSCRNHINNLVYGNGGVKLWPVHVINEMRTHEVAESDRLKLDFCWDLDYLQRNEVLSVARPNGSPLQAFRAGLREGVKMSLVNGALINDQQTFKQQLFHLNLHRLKIWMSVGADVQHGDWAIYGSRLGFWLANFDDFDITLINDYEYIRKMYNEAFYAIRVWDNLMIEIETLGESIARASDLEVEYFDYLQSALFKSKFFNGPRVANPRPIV